MRQFEWVSDAYPERDRFDAIRTLVVEEMGLRVEVAPDDRSTFQTRVSHHLSSGFSRVSSVSDPYTVFRGERELARLRHPSAYVIYRQRSKVAWFQLKKQEFETKAGDLIVSDSALGATSVTHERSCLEYWRVPKVAVDPYLPATGGLLGLYLPYRAGVEALIGSLLDSLGQNMDLLPEAAVTATLDHACRLVGVACGMSLGEQRESVAAARLLQAKDMIARNLADPDLSPATLAAQLRMSVRRLHALFEPSGESFAQHVQKQRLDFCRNMIADPAFAARSVTDIALGWGFGSLPTFYRAFRRTYGLAPGDLRSGGSTD